jgi:hypothetical protein
MTALIGGLSLSTASAQVAPPPEPACTPIAKTKLRLRKVDDGIGNERLLFRGEMELDETLPIDFATTGLEFQMIDGAGASVLDVTLPGVAFGGTGYGWSTNGHGAIWNWRDGDSAVSGMRRVVVKRPPRANELKLVFFGQDFEYPLPTLPITIRVLFSTSDGTTALCGQQIAQEVECFFRNQGNKLICR